MDAITLLEVDFAELNVDFAVPEARFTRAKLVSTVPEGVFAVMKVDSAVVVGPLLPSEVRPTATECYSNRNVSLW